MMKSGDLQILTSVMMARPQIAHPIRRSGVPALDVRRQADVEVAEVAAAG
jgi:hypothetical protein